MSRSAFDGLRVIRREWESETGWSDVCAAPDGREYIRLGIRDTACQRDFLSGRTDVSTRLERGVLEAVFPCREGMRLERWLEECGPTLGQRRDACMAVVAECIECPLPACVVALSAHSGNLRFSPGKAWLQMLPDWGSWQTGLDEPAAVRAAAAVCRGLLVTAAPKTVGGKRPPELELLLRRADGGDYLDWGQLQRDLAGLPESVPGLRERLLSGLGRIRERLARFAGPALYLAAGILLAAALLSLAGRYRSWRTEQEGLWPGMTPVGGQELGGERDARLEK